MEVGLADGLKNVWYNTFLTKYKAQDDNCESTPCITRKNNQQNKVFTVNSQTPSLFEEYLDLKSNYRKCISRKLAEA